ncbi:hypothetical protein ACI3KW_05825, partial [Devosia sp. ZW T5_3]|uniref:hypothetical protein n=1 Tax=Devosia sp. ZW T5_3 TaxID=3378085 RepID=UPI0038555807
QEWYRLNRTLHKKRIVTGGHWPTLSVSEGPMAARYRITATPHRPGGIFGCPVWSLGVGGRLCVGYADQ